MLRDGLTMESLIMDGNETFASMEGGSLARSASMAQGAELGALSPDTINAVREVEGAQIG